jgi:hypothetical protein
MAEVVLSHGRPGIKANAWLSFLQAFQTLPQMTSIAGYFCFSVQTVGHTHANKVTVLYVPDCDIVELLTDTVIQG